MDDEERYGFGGKKPTPANPEAEKLAAAILAVIDTESRLADAIDRVPSYTGQWRDEDYYAREQEERNRAVDALYDLLRPRQ